MPRRGGLVVVTGPGPPPGESTIQCPGGRVPPARPRRTRGPQRAAPGTPNLAWHVRSAGAFPHCFVSQLPRLGEQRTQTAPIPEASMRGTVLPVAVAVLLAGCGLDSDPTAPDNGAPRPGAGARASRAAARGRGHECLDDQGAAPRAAVLRRGRRAERSHLRRGRLGEGHGRHPEGPGLQPRQQQLDVQGAAARGRWAPSAGVINGVLYVAGGTDGSFKPTTRSSPTHPRPIPGRPRPRCRSRADVAPPTSSGEAVRVQPMRDHRCLPALRSGDQHLAAADTPGPAPPATLPPA